MTKKFEHRARSSRLSRRRFVRGVGGITLSLPFLESLEPRAAKADNPSPRRLVIMFKPDGSTDDEWLPSGGETDFVWNKITQALEPIRSDVILFKGLSMNSAGKDVVNDPGHPTCMRHMLTGGGDNSIDQVIAGKLGAPTPFKSRELGVGTQSSGDGASRMSYLEGTGLNPEPDPNVVFSSLFGGGAGGPATGASADQIRAYREQRKSVIDAVMGELGAISPKLGAEDRKLLDRHLSSLRDLENSIAALPVSAAPNCGAPGIDLSAAGPGPYTKDDLSKASLENFDKVAKVQLDLMILALRCDLTRVASLFYARTTPAQLYPFLPGVSLADGHHDMTHVYQDKSHHGNEQGEYLTSLRAIDRWYLEQFVYLVQQLKDSPDGPGGATIFDNSCILRVTEFGSGRLHARKDLRWILSGRGGGKLKLGRYLTYEDAAHTRLFLNVAEALGVPLPSFDGEGDSPLAGIST